MKAAEMYPELHKTVVIQYRFLTSMKLGCSGRKFQMEHVL
jgi:hypothetical protein